MNGRIILLVVGAFLAGSVGLASAQIPGVPGGAPPAGVPGAAPFGGAAGAPTPAAAAPLAGGGAGQMNIFSFLLPSPEQLEAVHRECEICRQRLCASQLGQMMNNSLRPLSAMSGGLLPPICPPAPTAAELAKAKAEGALGGGNAAAALAAEIKASEAEAKARRGIIRFLGTVDCARWPETQDALVNALRTDTNECVRWEAAMALGSGCCCTKKTIAGLTHCVSGESKDGNPPERSERVREAAMAALEHCLSCYQEKKEETKEPEPVRPPERTSPMPMPQENVGIRLTAYYARLESKTTAQVVADAREVMQRNSRSTMSIEPPRGERHLFGYLSNAWRGGPTLPIVSPSKTVAEQPIATQEMPQPPVNQPVGNSRVRIIYAPTEEAPVSSHPLPPAK